MAGGSLMHIDDIISDDSDTRERGLWLMISMGSISAPASDDEKAMARA